jgi:hypothetical protein
VAPVNTRHTTVGYHEIERLRTNNRSFEYINPDLSTLGRNDLVAIELRDGFDCPRDLGVVVDKENAHESASPA